MTARCSKTKDKEREDTVQGIQGWKTACHRHSKDTFEDWGKESYDE